MTHTVRPSRARVVALLLLFVGSGASALIYELVWFHWLRTVVGASSVSLAALLVSFMGGMGLGSLVLPVVVSPTRHPLRVYAALELGIAVCGVALLLGLPLVQVGYLAFAGEGAGILLRAAVCTLCLLPPTVLMGATLPTIARWTTTTPEGGLPAWPVLRCQHRRRGSGNAPRQFLSASGLRHVRRHGGRGRRQRGRRGGGPLAGASGAESAAGHAGVHVRRTGLPPVRPGGDWPLGPDRSGGRGRLDAPTLAVVRGDRVHVLAGPGGLPGGTRSRWNRRGGPGETASAPRPRPRRVSTGSGDRPALRRHDDRLADSPLARTRRHLVGHRDHRTLRVQHAALRRRHVPRDRALGRECSLRPGCRGGGP